MFLTCTHVLETRVCLSCHVPPKISLSYIRFSIARFENRMTLASGHTICFACESLIASTDIRRFFNGYSLLRLLEGFLDSHGCNNEFRFRNLYSICYAALLRGLVSTPKRPRSLPPPPGVCIRADEDIGSGPSRFIGSSSLLKSVSHRRFPKFGMQLCPAACLEHLL